MDLSFKTDGGGGVVGEWPEALAGQDFCCQNGGPEFDPRYHIGRREPASESCSLKSTHARVYTHANY